MQHLSSRHTIASFWIFLTGRIIYIAKSNDKVYLTNMYDGFNIRSELLKSRQFYNNVFRTAVNYDELMQLKKELKVWKNS